MNFNGLSDTACDFFNFIQSFGNKLKARDFVNLWLLEDQLQDLDSVTCGIFKVYLYNNLFNPQVLSKIQNKKKLTKVTVETLLKELFVLNNQEQNEETIRQYA